MGVQETAEHFTGILCDIDNFTIEEMDRMIKNNGYLIENINEIREQQNSSGQS